MTSTANSTVTFRLEESYDFLQLDKLTGQLWFKQSSWKKNFPYLHNLVVTAEKSDGSMARMTMDLNFVVVDNVNEFCETFMCFYESVRYHTIEDFNENFNSHEVGEISPKIYGRLCKTFEVRYELMNCELIINSCQRN